MTSEQAELQFTAPKEYQPRYVQFARVRGFEPGSDEAPMLYEYINWIRASGASGRKVMAGMSTR